MNLELVFFFHYSWLVGKIGTRCKPLIRETLLRLRVGNFTYPIFHIFPAFSGNWRDWWALQNWLVGRFLMVGSGFWWAGSTGGQLAGTHLVGGVGVPQSAGSWHITPAIHCYPHWPGRVGNCWWVIEVVQLGRGFSSMRRKSLLESCPSGSWPKSMHLRPRERLELLWSLLYQSRTRWRIAKNYVLVNLIKFTGWRVHHLEW